MDSTQLEIVITTIGFRLENIRHFDFRPGVRIIVDVNVWVLLR